MHKFCYGISCFTLGGLLKDFRSAGGLFLRHCCLVLVALAWLWTGACSSSADNEHSGGEVQKPLPSIEVKAHTDRTTATIADPITFSLKAYYLPGIKVRLPEVGSQIAGLRIIDFGEDGPKQIDNRMEYRKWYTLRADLAGSYIVPSMVVAYTDEDGTAKELKTPQIFIQIKSVLTDEKGEKSQDIIDVKPLETVKRNVTPFIIAAGAVIGIAAIIAVILIYVQKRKKIKQRAQLPAHIIALQELEKLQKEGLIQRGVVREHFFRLSDIFRQYVEDRFAVPAVEQTTQELVPELLKLEDMSIAVKSKAEEFLIHSDLVKFAKHVPGDDEVTESHAKVMTVIEKTKKEPLENGEKQGR